LRDLAVPLSILFAGFSLIISIGAVFPPPSLAADFGPALSITTLSVPPGADSASIGNAWTATPKFSTYNPGTIAACDPYKVGGSFTYGLLAFGHGPNINLYMGTLQAARELESQRRSSQGEIGDWQPWPIEINPSKRGPARPADRPSRLFCGWTGKREPSVAK